ncbi:MAG: P1 family peptidase [Gemmatimonadota bacterium]
MRLFAISGLLMVPLTLVSAQQRAREIGVKPGIFPPGSLNAITDVQGVRVGQTTIVSGTTVRTGITAILPHGENPFLLRVPAAIVVGNGFGKLLGSTQVNELGELESPILLTCTLCVWRVADAAVDWMLRQPGMGEVRSLNPVVAETNDGYLNDIRSRPVTAAQVEAAITSAASGPVAEGSVGAGTGTMAFGWKGGIGTSSRLLPKSLGGWTVGVLVQTNFGGVLQVLGVPIGRELGRYAFKEEIEGDRGDGSVIIVVATDAPILDRNLRRLASRALMGLARTGSSASNGSGDYVIAFSNAASMRRPVKSRRPEGPELENEEMSALFEAVVEATEEAIYNSLFMATTVEGNGKRSEAIPLDRVKAILARYDAQGR